MCYVAFPSTLSRIIFKASINHHLVYHSLDSVKSRYSRSLLTRISPIQILTLSNKLLVLNWTNRTYLKWVNNIIWVIAEVISTTRLPECKTNGTLPLDVQRKSFEQSLYKPRKHCNGGHPNMSDQIHIHSKGLILIIKYQVSNQIMTPRLNVRQTWYPLQYWFN